MFDIIKKRENVIESKIHTISDGETITSLVLSPKIKKEKSTGVLWIHGGGYFLGMKEKVYNTRMYELINKHNLVVISPGYRLAFYKPYPAAINDCYSALLYMKEHAEELGINKDQIFVGGESAGGGLTASLCIMARDKGQVNIAYQMPLYPMIDNYNTVVARKNYGRVWNIRRNHIGWRLYLRDDERKEVSPYAAAARCKDYSNLPKAYTFVGTGEPFYEETMTYIDNLKKAGVEAYIDTYNTNIHAFDYLAPKKEFSKIAVKRFNERFEYAVLNYFAENN